MVIKTINHSCEATFKESRLVFSYQGRSLYIKTEKTELYIKERMSPHNQLEAVRTGQEAKLPAATGGSLGVASVPDASEPVGHQAEHADQQHQHRGAVLQVVVQLSGNPAQTQQADHLQGAEQAAHALGGG